MKLFIDTANLSEIEQAASLGVIDGVTTNPSLLAKEGASLKQTIEKICQLVDGPISAEVNSEKAEEMLAEADELASLHKNVVIKLPLTQEGLKACQKLSAKNIKTNVTLVFSPNQALLAAKSGATYVSPFVGRLDDQGHEGMLLIEEIRRIFDLYGFNTQILSASIRHPNHVRMSALSGAHVATIPFKVLNQMYQHPLTTHGLEIFRKDFLSQQK